MTLYIPGTHGMEYDEDAARTYAHAQMFLGELKAIDSRLELVWAKPNAESLDGGFWYIVRHNEHAPDTYWQINDGAGEYSDPEWRHLERFKAADTAAHPDIYRNYRARENARIAQGEQSRAELHREFREKLDARLKHLYEVQIHVPVDVVAELRARDVAAARAGAREARDTEADRGARWGLSCRYCASAWPNAATIPARQRGGRRLRQLGTIDGICADEDGR